MTQSSDYDRREFIKISALATGGLLVSIFLSACSEDVVERMAATPTVEPTETPNPEAVFAPGLFVKIDGTGAVTITIHKPDIGQGVRTAFAMILADELGADWESIRIEQADADVRFGSQGTGGSGGVSDSFTLLRRAGAAARMVLIAAAANRWRVPEGECRVERGMILHTPSAKQLSFADVIEEAAALPVPRIHEVELKDPGDFQIIGSSPAPFNHADMVTGKIVYGSDLQIPGMVYAVLTRSPVPYGELISFDGSKAEAIDGVEKVFAIAGGVAVVGRSAWSVIEGRRALEVQWEDGYFADLRSEDVYEELFDRVVPEGWQPDQDGPDALSAVYSYPFYAHATQEPLCCVAYITDEHCEIWAPTQVPGDVASIAASVTGLPSESIHVHIPMIGGGFGRRLRQDFAREAIELAMELDSPVKLFWTREDDLRHDFYHPYSVHYVSASLDPLSMPRLRTATYERVPTGPWRAVTNIPEAFARESFLDEMAEAVGMDPLDIRLDLHRSYMLPVIEKAALEADWGSPLPTGWGRGIACHATWDVTPTAQVAEVSVSENGEVRVHRVVCAVDPGLAVHPEMIKAQMEGGIVFGLTAVLKNAITFRQGRVQQENFHQYPLLRMDEMPKVEVHILESGGLPTGVGEMGVPPIGPAICNAIFDATGVRLRRLPVRAEDLAGS